MTGDRVKFPIGSGLSIAVLRWQVRGRRTILTESCIPSLDPVPCFNASVIHTGDVEHGGTLKGVIAAVGIPLAQPNEDTRIIPGHRALDDLEAERGNGNFNGDRWIAVIYDVI